MGSWDRPAHAQLDASHFRLAYARCRRHRCFAIRFSSATPRLRTTRSTGWRRCRPDGAVRMSSLDTIEQHAKGITQSLILCAHTHVARAVRLRDGRLDRQSPAASARPAIAISHPYPHVIEAGTPDARYAILELANRKRLARHVPARALRSRHDGCAGARQWTGRTGECESLRDGSDKTKRPAICRPLS